MNRSVLALAAILPLSCGCGGQSFWLGQYEGHIEKGTAAIASAKTDRERSAGYVERARGYGEKARYLRAFKRIGLEEYSRLFEQAVLV